MRKLYILIFALSLFTGTAFGQMVKGSQEFLQVLLAILLL